MRRVFIIIGILLIPAIPIVLVVSGVIKAKPITVNRVTLTVWGTSDPKAAFSAVFSKFQATHSYVTINYKQVSATDYKSQLISAWAQNTGPDIFFVPHTWVGAMSSYATPLPTDLSIPIITVTKGLFGTQQNVTKPSQPAPSLTTVKSAFVEAVSTDIVRDGQVWAYPLAMDSLALYSNKDLLDNAKIFTPAVTWGELYNQIINNGLTILDDQGTIIQSGVALGTTSNIPYANDILTILMMQNGAQMIDASKRIRFQQDTAGINALNFFTSFAQPNKETYSWNGDLTNARDAFVKGKLVYYIGTLADQAAIAKSGVNWQVTNLPHLDAQGDKDPNSTTPRFMNVPVYNVGMVSKASKTAKRSTYAWSLLNFMTQSKNVGSYLNATGQLSALRNTLASQTSDPKKSVFATQLLTARSWYTGKDAVATDGYLHDMIQSILKDGTDPQTALNLAANQIQATL